MNPLRIMSGLLLVVSVVQGCSSSSNTQKRFFVLSAGLVQYASTDAMTGTLTLTGPSARAAWLDEVGEEVDGHATLDELTSGLWKQYYGDHPPNVLITQGAGETLKHVELQVAAVDYDAAAGKLTLTGRWIGNQDGVASMSGTFSLSGATVTLFDNVKHAADRQQLHSVGLPDTATGASMGPVQMELAMLLEDLDAISWDIQSLTTQMNQQLEQLQACNRGMAAVQQMKVGGPWPADALASCASCGIASCPLASAPAPSQDDITRLLNQLRAAIESVASLNNTTNLQIQNASTIYHDASSLMSNVLKSYAEMASAIVRDL